MKNLLLASALLTGFIQFSQAQNFQARQQQYIDSVVTNDYEDAIMIQAFNGDPVNQASLDEIYGQFQTRSTIDFKLVELVRVMYLTDGSYDQQILAQLETLPYWINDGDTLHNYWTENHQIMWGSTEWLMHERHGWDVDENLRKRLVHYLNLKLEVGFHEYFSSTYFPYTLSGLMNLADFAQDEELQSKAEAVARELMRKFILVCNSEGVYYPAAGRNFPGRYNQRYGANHNAIIYMITGRGPCPSENLDRADFIATTSIDFSDLENEFESELDTIYSFGYTPEEALLRHDSLYYIDELMMQWSGGLYFHPYIANETVGLMVDSNFIYHTDFTDFSFVVELPLEDFTPLATELDELTVGRTDCGADIAIFKNDETVLTSNLDFWKGKIGFQQWPIAANVGGTAVYTASGFVDPVWNNRNSSNFNEHLPYIDQQSNVALVMYRPQSVSSLLPYNNKDVALHWIEEDFDSVDENGNWLFGNRNENYVAVRRACVGEINGIRACETDGGQTWVIIVGNDAMYGDYNAFRSLVDQAVFSEEWTSDMNGDSTYYASITFEGNTIEHYWDPEQPFVGVEESEKINELTLFPNPSSGVFQIQLPSDSKELYDVEVFDVLGNLVYQASVSDSNATIDLSGKTDGTYLVRLTDNSAVWTGRVLKLP